jgi:hypothetical protein
MIDKLLVSMKSGTWYRLMRIALSPGGEFVYLHCGWCLKLRTNKGVRSPSLHESRLCTYDELFDHRQVVL